MSAVVFKLNSKGMEELLRSPGVHADLQRRAEAIARAANQAAGLDGDFIGEATIDKTRAHGRVWTATVQAMIAEAQNRTLTQSFDAGRG